MPNIFAALKAIFSTYEPFYALKKSFQDGYTKTLFKNDVIAGIIVGLVAIPLSMSLAIASGAPPQNGLYTAVAGGIIIALLGGSRTQVTGPTAAFIALLYPIVIKYGLSGFLLCGFMAGIILVIMGLSGMGKLIKFIPYPVTIGFTSGIAVVIFSIQLKDFFGLHHMGTTSSFIERMIMFAQHLKQLNGYELGTSFVTLVGLVLWPKFNKKIPAPIIVLPLVTLSAYIMKQYFHINDISTILTTFHGDNYQGIPSGFAQFSSPWSFKGFNFALITELIIPATSIALLASIESLLSAVIADGMAKTRHNPDSELVALGVGNMVCPFIGAIPATGALARTSTNIKFGATSPFASVTQGLFIIIVLLFLAPIISYIPMGSLAALLMVVAYNMLEWDRFTHIVKVGPKSDVVVLLTCFVLTVVFDMVVGVLVGIVLASLLFMRRTIELSDGTIFSSESIRFSKLNIPEGVVLYQIIGPMFFGVAEKVIRSLDRQRKNTRAWVLLMDHVWSMDMTALVSFSGILDEIKKNGQKIILVGIRTQPMQVLNKAGLLGECHDHICHADSLDEAIQKLQKLDQFQEGQQD